MDDGDRLPLATNMVIQADNSNTELSQGSSDSGVGNNGNGDSAGPGGEVANGGQVDEMVGTREDGDDNGDTGSTDLRDPDNPYAGVIALTEIGIRDSREMIQTVLGLGRYLYQMSCKDKFFGFVGTVVFLASFSVILIRLSMFDLLGSPDLTMAIVLLINTLFLIYYVYSGLFYERPFEIACAVLSMLSFWAYLVINYALSSQGYFKMARLMVASAFGPFLIVVGCTIIRSYMITSSVVFRICGSNKLMQYRCTTLFKFLALIKADLQVGVTLAILVLKDGFNLGVAEWVVFPLALIIAISHPVLGYLMVRYENGRMVLAFLAMWFLLPAYCIYLIIKAAMFVQAETRTREHIGLAVMIFVAMVFSILLRVLILIYILKVFSNFGFGLRQKAFEGYIDEENRERRDPNDFIPWRGYDPRNYGDRFIIQSINM